MIDLKDFWLALRFSWLRRTLTTKSFWLYILETEIFSILGHNLEIGNLLEIGPTKLSLISKYLNNIFWKEVLKGVNHFMQRAVFRLPEKFILAPLWDNPMIQRNKTPLKEAAMPIISQK